MNAPRPRIDFDRVNEAAIKRSREIVGRLLGGGHVEFGEYVALNSTRNDKHLGSFRIRLTGPRAGAWCDHATDEGGGDLVALAAYVRRLNQAEAARHVLDLLNEDPASFSEPAQERSEEKPPETDQKKLASILALWRECRDPHGTIVERYLREHRKVELPDNAAEVIRYHPNCFFDGKRRERCMVALIRNIKTNAPQGIHRTALTPDGKEQRDATTGKTRRLSWGHVKHGAIKLTADEHIGLCLGIGEGAESTLSFWREREFGQSPIWSLICAGGFSWLPVINGIETLWIAADHDPTGLERAAALRDRWRRAGREVFLIINTERGKDLNDCVRRRQ